MELGTFLTAALAVLVTVSSSIPHGCDCETSAVPHQGYWYQSFRCPLPWVEAARYCQQSMRTSRGSTLEGGALAWIDDRAERQWLAFFLYSVYGKLHPSFWLGGRRVKVHRRRPRHHLDGFTVVNPCSTWAWYHGKRINMDQCWWAVHEPDNRFGKENCLAVDSRAVWKSLECQIPLPFVCKRPIYSNDPDLPISGPLPRPAQTESEVIDFEPIDGEDTTFPGFTGDGGRVNPGNGRVPDLDRLTGDKPNKEHGGTRPGGNPGVPFPDSGGSRPSRRPGF